jgi:hypothetical protein
MIEQDKQSWKKGRVDAMRGAPSKCPKGVGASARRRRRAHGDAARTPWRDRCTSLAMIAEAGAASGGPQTVIQSVPDPRYCHFCEAPPLLANSAFPAVESWETVMFGTVIAVQLLPAPS